MEATHFQLYKRAKHVFTEALRVLQFRQTCLSSSTGDVIRQLGKLMNESQTSCNELYECSCPELNQLTQIARDAGAFGSRLTGKSFTGSNACFADCISGIGAGWGGCTVSLVVEDDVDAFIKRVSEAYAPYKELSGDALKEVIFATKPSSGASGKSTHP